MPIRQAFSEDIGNTQILDIIRTELIDERITSFKEELKKSPDQARRAEISHTIATLYDLRIDINEQKLSGLVNVERKGDKLNGRIR